MRATASSVRSFREEFFASQPSAQADDPFAIDRWAAWGARKDRYFLYWSLYTNDIYRNITRVAQEYRTENGLYRYIQPIYNPTERLVEFHATHVGGGDLEDAFPITGETDAIHEAIEQLMEDSSWEEAKDAWPRYGSCLGDGPIRLRDDPTQQKIAIEVIHPATIADVEWGPFGRIMRAVIIEKRAKPGMEPPPVTNGQSFARWQTAMGLNTVEYREDMVLDPATGDVTITTYLDGAPYPWNGVSASETLPLGEIPLWVVRHRRNTLPWGVSEIEAMRKKSHAVDDLASVLHDQLRKIGKGAWMVTGQGKPSATLQTTETQPVEESPEQARQMERVIWVSNPDAKLHSMIHDVDIPAISAEIRQRLDSIEDDHPELRFQRLQTGGRGDVSGEALRTARQPAAAAIRKIRAAYDSTLLRAVRAAIWLGKLRGYPVYDACDVSGVGDEALLELELKPRPVFTVDVQDKLGEEQQRAILVQTYTAAGVPLMFAMKRAGFTDEELMDMQETPATDAEELALDSQKASIDAIENPVSPDATS